MYDFEQSLETSARVEDVWAIYTDVPGWHRWLPHIDNIHCNGAFETDTTGYATVQVGLPANVEFRLDNVVPMSQFDVVWTVGPLLHTRMVHKLEAIPGGTRFSHAYHTGGIMAPFNFLQAAAARERVGPAMATIAELAKARR